jgi:hypothetical protein
VTTHPTDSNFPRRATAGTSRPLDLDDGRRRPPMLLVTLGALALGAAVAAAVWFFAVRSDKSTPTTTAVASVIKPIALSSQGLETLGRAVGQPIYWAGKQRGFSYELSRLSNGNVYVRYLPSGVDAGAKGARFLVVATYPYRGAFATLKKLAAGHSRSVPGGGIAYVDPKKSTSVHVAFPNVNYQVEVYAPASARALAVALSGRVVPVP